MSIELLKKIRTMRCVVCEKIKGDQSYPVHIIPRRRGGPTEAWNVLAMCADHHIQWHLFMAHRMCQEYPHLAKIISDRGFYFESLDLKHPILEGEKEEIKKKLVSKVKYRKDGTKLP